MKLGGANFRFRIDLDGFACDGERPAALTGAERGVIVGLTNVSTRGVCISEDVGVNSLLVGTIFVLSLFDCFANETSSSKKARLRLADRSKVAGSMFSESESSGDGALLFRLGAEYGVMAVFR